MSYLVEKSTAFELRSSSRCCMTSDGHSPFETQAAESEALTLICLPSLYVD